MTARIHCENSSCLVVVKGLSLGRLGIGDTTVGPAVIRRAVSCLLPRPQKGERWEGVFCDLAITPPPRLSESTVDWTSSQASSNCMMASIALSVPNSEDGLTD